MKLRELLEPLYTARNHFTTVKVMWSYWYRADIMHEARERWVAQHAPGSVSMLKTKSGKRGRVQTAVTINRQVWWQKPACWRYEEQVEEQKTIIKIRCQNRWWIFDSASRKLYTNVLPEQSHQRIQKSKRSPIPTLEDFIWDVPLLDPSFLLFCYDLEVGEDTVHAGREAIRVRATPRKGREMNRDAFFWAGADEYEFLVDKKQGILLRYAAKLGDREFAVASVKEVVFNEQIPDSVFSFTAPANTSIVISS